MTKVSIDREGDLIVSFRCQGHAGNLPAGENIVCAAVSALAQTAILGVVQVAGDEAEWYIDEERAEVLLTPKDPSDIRVQTVLQTFAAGIESIVESVPDAVRIINGKRR